MTDILVHDITLTNRRGIHARSAAKIVQLVESFAHADATLSLDGQTVGGTSIMGLLMLGAIQGKTVTITTTGAEKDALLSALKNLFENKFGETE